MKKTIVLIATMISLAVAAYSQGSVVASYIKLGIKNSDGKMEFEKNYKECGITFTMRDNYITANDKANSVYRIVNKKEIEDDGLKESQDYECTDEKDRGCVITIAVYKNGEKYLSVCYENCSFIYKVN